MISIIRTMKMKGIAKIQEERDNDINVFCLGGLLASNLISHTIICYVLLFTSKQICKFYRVVLFNYMFCGQILNIIGTLVIIFTYGLRIDARNVTSINLYMEGIIIKHL